MVMYDGITDYDEARRNRERIEAARAKEAAMALKEKKTGRPRAGQIIPCADCGTEVYVRAYRYDANREYRCLDCAKKKNPEHAALSWKNEHEQTEQPKVYQCKKCGEFSTTDRRVLISHYSSVHNWRYERQRKEVAILEETATEEKTEETTESIVPTDEPRVTELALEESKQFYESKDQYEVAARLAAIETKLSEIDMLLTTALEDKDALDDDMKVDIIWAILQCGKWINRDLAKKVLEIARVLAWL